MNQFLKDIFITLSISIVIFALIDIFIPLPQNDYSVKQKYIETHANDIKTLIIGNSLAANGFDAHVLGDSTYCYAMSGRVLYYDLKLMEQYLPYMDNLKTVILTLHYNLHAYVRFDSANIEGTKDYIYKYYRYTNISLDTFPYGFLYRSSIFSNHLHMRKNEVSCDAVGNTFYEDTWNGEKENHNPPNQLHLNMCIAYLTQMAKMLENKGVRFIVVTPPFPDIWLSECSSEGIDNLYHIADTINSITQMEYRCYLTDAAFRTKTLYTNWNHLNHRGATLFAERVKKDFGL